MIFDPNLHHRRSIRLKDYDYSQTGAYFITICTFDRKCIFGDISDGKMHLNQFGEIVKRCWLDLPNHYAHVILDTMVIMPNHIHCIIMLTDESNAGVGLKPAPASKHGLPEIIRALKTFSSRRINELRGTPGTPVWQRNYYEHVIRKEAKLDEIRRYIVNNPIKWELDEENPLRLEIRQTGLISKTT